MSIGAPLCRAKSWALMMLMDPFQLRIICEPMSNFRDDNPPSGPEDRLTNIVVSISAITISVKLFP